jgi:hypothetical protein
MSNVNGHDRQRVSQLADEAAQHGDLLGAAMCAKSLGDDVSGYALTAAERATLDSTTQEEAIRQVSQWLADEEHRKGGD